MLFICSQRIITENLDIPNKQPESRIISILQRFLAVSMSTPSIQIARGRPLNFFFSDRNTQIQTHQLRRTALECHSTPLPGSANNFLSTAFACCARGISWSGKIASRAAIGGSNYCDKSAVWSQHHPERTPRFSAEKLNMLVGYRISHTRSDRSNWCCERSVCGSERSNFSAQGIVRQASHQTLAVGSQASELRVLRYGSDTGITLWRPFFLWVASPAAASLLPLSA